MRSKSEFETMLGFAARARACVSGYTAVESGIRHRKLKLVVLDEALSENTREKLTALCSARQIPYILLGPPGQLGSRIGKPAAKMAGITQDLFAKRMLTLMQSNETEV